MVFARTSFFVLVSLCSVSSDIFHSSDDTILENVPCHQAMRNLKVCHARRNRKDMRKGEEPCSCFCGNFGGSTGKSPHGVRQSRSIFLTAKTQSERDSLFHFL